MVHRLKFDVVNSLDGLPTSIYTILFAADLAANEASHLLDLVILEKQDGNNTQPPFEKGRLLRQ